jgi:hypothetical protein
VAGPAAGALQGGGSGGARRCGARITVLASQRRTPTAPNRPRPPPPNKPRSVLLWHRSDNLAFAIVTGGSSLLQRGEAVECKIKGVLQVVDEAKGPITKKDYDFMQAPAGWAFGGVKVG